MSTRQEIASICKNARESVGMSQQELSEVMGISKSRIRNLEDGKVKIRDGEASTYSLYFKIDPRQFIERTPKFYNALPEIKRIIDLKNVNMDEMSRAFGLSNTAIKVTLCKGTRVFLKKELDDISFYLNVPVKSLMTEEVPAEDLPAVQSISYICNHPWHLIDKEKALMKKPVEVVTIPEVKEDVEALKTRIKELEQQAEAYKTEADILRRCRDEAVAEKEEVLNEVARLNGEMSKLASEYIAMNNKAAEYKEQLFDLLLKNYKNSKEV